MSFFDVTLYAALAVFGIGLAYKVSTWFRYNITAASLSIPPSRRALAAARGVAAIVFGPKILVLGRVFLVDVLLQLQTLKQDPFRWLMHILLFWGFMVLLLMHALESLVTARIFPDYHSTLNPFLFIRDFAGVMVILGIGLALYRRFVLKPRRLKSGGTDIFAVAILALVMASGSLLKSSKIISYARYQEMVEEYSFPGDEDEAKTLEAYWVEKYGLVSQAVSGPFDTETLEMGRDAHDASCLDCHSRPLWAPLSYAGSRLLAPAAGALDSAGVPKALWYIHFLAAFLGLAYLPFSKLFHIFASPLSLLANAVMERGSSDPANIATRQVMELDACTHCGACTLNCAVGVAYEEIPNANILPSEKIASIRGLISGKKLTERQFMDLLEGMYLCTNCYRCTIVCPVGINLQELWFNVRELLLSRGRPELLTLSSFSFYRGCMQDSIAREDYLLPPLAAKRAVADEHHLAGSRDKVLSHNPADARFKSSLSLSEQGSTFSLCFACKTCTASCPVVRNYENPREALGLMPHQIIHASVLGFRDLALGSNMLWACLACYQCQEFCPQGVRVTDVFYELKNLAVRYSKERDRKGE